ncbi:MAG: DUF4197 domain-containing protein [Saprospiraceae bacterium]|nr:DUF4197 domain-containing protein [Saprospiraceae bacterium]
MNRFLILIILLLGYSAADAQFKDVLKKAKSTLGVATGDESEMSAALKEALNVGVDAAVKQLSADKGYLESPFKILIPEDAQKVIDKVKMVPGFQDVETKLIHQMNQAAEIAAKKATPIFVGAIKQMTVKDAASIISGADNAATSYLETTSRQPLYDQFLPVIQASLDEVNARTYWKTVVEAYNKIPFVKKMNPALDDHVNNKGLDGLFSLIAVKEKGIRTDISQRTSDLLRKVFGK